MQILAQETSGKTPSLHKWFNRDNLIILVLAGILLFVISLPIENKKQDGVLSKTDSSAGYENKTDTSHGVEQNEKTEEDGELESYARAQEAKLEELLSSMEGVGSVEVMLTFISSKELVVEKDEPTVRSNTVEKDSVGGNRTVSQFESGDSTVYSSVSGESIPYVVKTLSPRVEGVLVVAEGASNSEINRNITEAVQALFGVEAHKVKVLSMGSGN